MRKQDPKERGAEARHATMQAPDFKADKGLSLLFLFRTLASIFLVSLHSSPCSLSKRPLSWPSPPKNAVPQFPTLSYMCYCRELTMSVGMLLR